MEFEKMRKIKRIGNSQDIMWITEKIDGTQAQVMIDENHKVTACSKNRILTAEKDNYGFYSWMFKHRDELINTLGPGRHYGEWWGSKIQRNYGYTNGKRFFSIFNTRIDPKDLSENIHQVPVLYTGPFDTHKIKEVADNLLSCGSCLSSNYHKPEGIVVYHVASKVSLKYTYDYNDGKWGEK